MRPIPLVITLVLGFGCGAPAPSPSRATLPPHGESHSTVNSIAAIDPESTIQKLRLRHLPNAVQVHERVISGGSQAGEAAFAELQSLGVRSIISVDGARPDVTTAKKYGLRYVHLPHGYDGVPAQRVNELAKAVRDLPGPIYLHCHHGKHRSPVAAAVACVAAGMLDPRRVPTLLALAGTSPTYRGLFESAERAQKLPTELLDQLAADFPEVASLPEIADVMVSIEVTHDRLQSIAKAGWQRWPADPSLDPAPEALLLREQFTGLLRTEEVGKQNPQFRDLLANSEVVAQSLVSALLDPRTPASPTTAAQFSAQLRTISVLCSECHRRFRDIPLSEKAATGN